MSGTSEILKEQFVIESTIWKVARDKDERANHANRAHINDRRYAMERIDGLLDCYIELELNVVRGDE